MISNSTLSAIAKPAKDKAPHPSHGEMGLCLHLALGLRVSRLLNLRAVSGPKTVGSSYSNVQRTSMKTRIQETVGRRQENFKDRKNGIGKQE